MSKSLPKPAALLLCGVPWVSLTHAAEHSLLDDQLVTAPLTAQTAQQSQAAPLPGSPLPIPAYASLWLGGRWYAGPAAVSYIGARFWPGAQPHLEVK